MLASGTGWVIASILLMIVPAVGSCLFWADDLLMESLFLFCNALGVVGYWQLTTPEAAPVEDRYSKLGTVARATQHGARALSLLSVALMQWRPRASAAVDIFVLAVALVSLAATLQYQRRLALRIPSPGLALRTRIVMYGLGAGLGLIGLMGIPLEFLTLSTGQGTYFIGSGSKIVVIGPVFAALLTATMVGSLLLILVFGIWHLVLMIQYRRAFRAAARLARELWVQTPSTFA
jgi:hypothetical protein